MKTILVLTAGFGEGHNTAARNIRAALEHRAGAEVRVDVLDLFELCFGRINTLLRHAYQAAIHRAPRVWQGLYQLSDRSEFLAGNALALRRLRTALEDILRAEEPDAVVSTYPLYSLLIEEIYREGRPRRFPCLTVVTDSISINSVWYRGVSDYFLVANDATAEVFTRHGIPAEKVRVTGFPVQMEFALATAPLDLSAPRRPRLLVLLSSTQTKNGRLLDCLLEREEWDLTICTGRDEKARRLAVKLASGHGRRVQVLGWTSRVAELLSSHHVVISKAGGAITQEAIAAQCPMIINQVVPGQEEGNCALIVGADAGVFAEKPSEVVDTVERAFFDGGRVWSRWRKNLAAISRPRAALEIADLILEKAAEGERLSAPAADDANRPEAAARNGRGKTVMDELLPEWNGALASSDSSPAPQDFASESSAPANGLTPPDLEAISDVSDAKKVCAVALPSLIPLTTMVHAGGPETRRMLLCDFHTHTTFSDGRLTVPELVDFYGVRGFDCLCITDHLCDPRRLIGRICNLTGLVIAPGEISAYFAAIEAEKARAWRQYKLLLMTGIEFNKDGYTRKTSAHLLGVDLRAPIDASLDLHATIAAIHQQGGLAIASHPHETQSAWGKDTLYLWENQDEFAPILDAWEIANRDDLFNPVGLKRLPFLGNSDFHKPKHIESWKTLLWCEKDAEAIKACIRQNRDVSLFLYRGQRFGTGESPEEIAAAALPLLGLGEGKAALPVGENAAQDSHIII